MLGEDLQLDETRVVGRLMEFFRERYRYLMRRSGYESDFIESIISVEFDRIHQLRSRMDELKKFASESKEFPALARTFKRVTNILKKQEQSFEIDPSLLKETCESTLWDTYQAVKDDVDHYIEEGAYYAPLELLARLRKPVDEFFDGVEVLTKENAVLRKNRIALLQHVLGLFRSVADFSKFQP